MTSTEAGHRISGRLRDETKSEHENAESRPFIHDLLAGALSLNAYAAYLAQYARIYRALESRVRQENDPALIADTWLRRTEAMEKDLAALGMADWESTTAPLPSTQAYVDHLTKVAQGPWIPYLAHHYVRYLGDLSGGRVIAAMLRRHYDAQDDQLQFFDFRNIGDHVAYKRRYREELDALDLTTAEVDDLVAESRLAFTLNSRLFDELERQTAQPA